LKGSVPALRSVGSCGASGGEGGAAFGDYNRCMRYRIVDDIAEDEEVTRLMREREIEADIAEKTRRLIDDEMDAVEIVEELQDERPQGGRR